MPEEAIDGTEIRRILVVHADETTRVSVKLVLELRLPDVAVELASHPSAARRLLAKVPFDLVITASRFPDSSGAQLIDCFRDAQTEVRTMVLLTAWSGDSAAKVDADADMTGTLDPDQLVYQVGRLLPPSIREHPTAGPPVAGGRR